MAWSDYSNSNSRDVPDDDPEFNALLARAGLVPYTDDFVVADHYHGHNSTWEEEVDDDLLAREVAKRKVMGQSRDIIMKSLHIGRPRYDNAMRRASTIINTETRELVTHWQALKVAQWEAVTARILPHVMLDPDHDEEADGPMPMPASRDVAALKTATLVEMAVMTLGRAGQTALPDDEDVIDAQAEETADLVEEYMELAQKMLTGVAASGYGSGEYTGADTTEEEDELERASRRADNSGTIEDAFVVDPRGEATEEEIDDLSVQAHGEWRDGKFYPDADADTGTDADTDDANDAGT